MKNDKTKKTKRVSLINALIILSFMIIFCSSVYSEDIAMKINSSEYYFLVNQNAVIPLELNNTYNHAVSGTLTYSISQQITQSGFQYSNSNTQQSSFSVPQGNSIVNLDFGTSENPSTMDISLSFNFVENESKIVSLDNIKIHFVSDDSQKQQNSQSQQSTSQSNNQQQSQSQNNQNNQNQQSSQQQEPTNSQMQQQQQKLQNNQLPADSNALKDEIKKQYDNQQKMKDEFQKELSKNSEFQKKHQEMLSEGYNLTNGNMNPTSNNTGDFNLNYEKNGETANLKGNMVNGTMQDIQKTSSEDTQKIMNQLRNNSDFKNYDKTLKKQGFNSTSPKISKQGNQTNIEIEYKNQLNETAKILSTIENEEIKKVELELKHSKNWLWYVFIIIILCVLSYFISKKLKKNKLELEVTPKKIEKTIDFRKEARKMIQEAKELFESNEKKEAYALASLAIRFFYRCKLETKKDITGFELVKLLKSKKINYEETQKCLNLCGLVEFAKYNPNKKDFDKIIDIAGKIIRE